MLAAVCQLAGLSAEVVPGVAHDLAQWRAAHISDVRYDLQIVISSSAKDAYRCKEIITFNLDTVADVQLDYQGELTGLGPKRMYFVNGKRVVADYRDEHFILHASDLKVGENTVKLTIENHSAALNHHNQFAYTLFVPDHARSVYACFDQPDLKARFTLMLTVPRHWEAIANGALVEHIVYPDDIADYKFATTEPLPTYLFSFTVGEFKRLEGERGGRRYVALHRESDPDRVAQLQTVFDQIDLSLRWLEDYTGIDYPFSHYDFVVLPGYQFGGMEHPGCVQFNDRRIFLGKNATLSEQLSRTNLLAHETAHMWFGDLVTMRWFDDVWTKEVFANFMADKITRLLYPDINHDLNFLKAHYVPAMATDRTDGTHPIRQELDNLNSAGLLYGNIIYHKAPLMMRILEQQVGEEAFRRGLQSYLRANSYGNATWDDLIEHLHQANPAAGVRDFDEVWVKQAGMPQIGITRQGRELTATQHDPRGRGLVWAQNTVVACDMNEVSLSWKHDSVARIMTDAISVIPNYNGSTYGAFLVDEQSADLMMQLWHYLPDLNRYAALLTLNENDIMRRIDRRKFADSVCGLLNSERNTLIAGTALSALQRIIADTPESEVKASLEQQLWIMARSHPVTSIAQQALRVVSTTAVTTQVVDSLYLLWNEGSPLLNERDAMRTAYHLAIVRPQQWQEILSVQRARLTNDDRRREFDFISRGCNPDTAVQDVLFLSLMRAENRAVEPDAAALLRLLNHPVREPASNRFIKQGLDILQEVQRTGDIFFPLNWCNALLEGHHSPEAAQAVRTFLECHPGYPTALRNKLLQAAYPLLSNAR